MEHCELSYHGCLAKLYQKREVREAIDRSRWEDRDDRQRVISCFKFLGINLISRTHFVRDWFLTSSWGRSSWRSSWRPSWRSSWRPSWGQPSWQPSWWSSWQPWGQQQREQWSSWKRGLYEKLIRDRCCLIIGWAGIFFGSHISFSSQWSRIHQSEGKSFTA